LFVYSFHIDEVQWEHNQLPYLLVAYGLRRHL
jgi:hypothetical protein